VLPAASGQPPTLSEANHHLTILACSGLSPIAVILYYLPAHAVRRLRCCNMEKKTRGGCLFFKGDEAKLGQRVLCQRAREVHPQCSPLMLGLLVQKVHELGLDTAATFVLCNKTQIVTRPVLGIGSLSAVRRGAAAQLNSVIERSINP
jgi:hypothetical protein